MFSIEEYAGLYLASLAVSLFIHKIIILINVLAGCKSGVSIKGAIIAIVIIPVSMTIIINIFLLGLAMISKGGV